jgi:hypothetical protein
MLAMLVTDATFHLETSSLNVGWLLNSEHVLLTAAVFQSPMLPYVVVAHVGSVTQEVEAVAMLVSVMHVAQREPTVHVATLNAGHAAWKLVPQTV